MPSEAEAAGPLASQGLGEEYAADPWNLANLARLGGKHGNLLRHVGEHVPGLTSPQLQLGSMLTSRPWAVAPQLLYSISYLHTGDAKKWCDHRPALPPVTPDPVMLPLLVRL